MCEASQGDAYTKIDCMDDSTELTHETDYGEGRLAYHDNCNR